MKFLDEAKIHIQSGKGGAGCVAFHREKFIEFGGPDGGDGGRGGSVFIEAVDNLNTLIDYRYKQHFKAKNGGHGMGKNRSGAKGADITLKVPVGTQVYDEHRQHLLADLTEAGMRLCLAEGGRGGLGNQHFKSSTNQAPKKAQPGEPGQEMWLWLHMKLIADFGLVGAPNAGKSTLLSVISAAKPKIADYPFTTLIPGLGVAEIDEQRLVIADIPGLIAGAHTGAGIGTKFLGHIERCAGLIHLVDGSSASLDEIIDAYQTIRHELAAYGAGLAEKPVLVAISKTDALSLPLAEIQQALAAEARNVAAIIPISSLNRQGLDTLLRHALTIAKQARQDDAGQSQNNNH